MLHVCTCLCLHRCLTFIKHVVLFVWSLVHLNITEQSVLFFWQHNKCCVFFSPINAASHTHKHTHPSVPPTPLSPFVFLGSPHLQTYYPESSAAAQLALRCWSVLLVTSAPSARSARLRSSGISPMENLNRIQKKPVHTSNCDRVFHQLNCSFFSLVPGWKAVSSHQCN